MSLKTLNKIILIVLFVQNINSKPINENPDLKSYRDERNPDLSYSFAYETADGQIREETGTFEEVDGQKQLVVRGKYSYIGPDGETYQVIYVSDKAGYRPEGDHLPMRKSLKSSMKTVMSTLLKRIQPNLVASLVG